MKASESPGLVILQYLLCLGEKMVFGLLSRSRTLSRSFWLLGVRVSSGFFSLLNRSRPVRMICSSILRWRFMSDRTLSSWASLFTEDRAEDPGKKEYNNHISPNTSFQKQANLWTYSFLGAPGVLRLDMKAFFGVACSSSKSNSVGLSGLENIFLYR